ncbi:hypothetical protein [Corticibacter populi]|uniref:hypothetical protein n=1 Tax=Corticibacter populi TaxID=1550736 RepID=UPI0010E0F79C|nr:hypothetical protein [Corticibacter populi]RZS32146.1 hypothetical protein EV687_2834 [Corticibacter populi]
MMRPAHSTSSSTRCGTGLGLLAASSVLLLAGCAARAPQGYGVAPEHNTAAQAQQQLQAAEQAARVDTEQTYLDLIVQMQQAGQWYASLAHTDAFEQQYGPRPEARLLRADALRNTGQAEAARTTYLGLLEGATAARARRGLGLLLAAQGHYAQAVQQLELARRLNPIDATVLSDIAYAHMLDGRLDAARIPIQQAAQLAPNNARVQLNLALFWLASGHQAEATALLQRLSRPQGKGAAPLIDPNSLPVLQQQLAQVQLAAQARSAGVAGATGAAKAEIAAAAPAAPVAPAIREASADADGGGANAVATNE